MCTACTVCMEQSVGFLLVTSMGWPQFPIRTGTCRGMRKANSTEMPYYCFQQGYSTLAVGDQLRSLSKDNLSIDGAGS